VETIRTPEGQTKRLPGTERAIRADLVLLAIGFSGPVRDRLLEELDPAFGPDGAILADYCYGTSIPGVFTAGDAKRGASLIVWAIAEWRKAAREIDRFLVGKSFL